MEEDPTIPEISEETVERVERAKYVLSKIQEYTDLIEMLRPLKRPMLLWSVASLVYVYGGLHFASGRAALWGVEIAGVTEQEFSFFYFWRRPITRSGGRGEIGYTSERIGEKAISLLYGVACRAKQQ